MKPEEYLNTVREQLQYPEAWTLVEQELKDHIQDQARDYQEEGKSPEEALELAVAQMGDPVETGAALNRIHRPKVSRGMLAMAGLLCLTGLLIQWAVESRAGVGFSRLYLLGIVLGVAGMLVGCHIDYRLLARYARPAAILWLCLFLGYPLLGGNSVNGRTVMMLAGRPIFQGSLLFLYAPIFGALLYRYRGKGWSVFLRAGFWWCLPVLGLLHLPAAGEAAALGIAMLLVMAGAIARGWYRVNKKSGLALLLGVSLVLLALPWLRIWMTGAPAYQMARLTAWIRGEALLPDVRNVLQSSRLVGSGVPDWSELYYGLVITLGNDRVLTFLMGSYGLLLTSAVIGALLLFVLWILRMAARYKGELGSILIFSCGCTYLSQLVVNVAVNLQLLPSTGTNLPFLSSSGCGIVTSYLLLGLVLGVHRRRNLGECPVV